MKSILLILSLFFVVTTTYAQTYYVAVIKGQVYYDNKPLKKRDKIKLQGNLRFSSLSDYVKVSGPGGLFTISPHEDNKVGSNEFLVAVKKELFPTTRFRSTVANNIISKDSSRFFGFEWISRTYFDGTTFSLNADLLAHGETVGFLHETDQGLFYQKADIKDTTLMLKARRFKIPMRGDQRPLIKQTAIVVIRDQEAWQKILSATSNMKELRSQLDEYMIYYSSRPDPISMAVYREGNVVEEAPAKPLPKAALILDFLGPSQFISKRRFLKDVRFHIKASGANSVREFLEDFEFDDYIEDTYGDVYQYFSVLTDEAFSK